MGTEATPSVRLAGRWARGEEGGPAPACPVPSVRMCTLPLPCEQSASLMASRAITWPKVPLAPPSEPWGRTTPSGSPLCPGPCPAADAAAAAPPGRVVPAAALPVAIWPALDLWAACCWLISCRPCSSSRSSASNLCAGSVATGREARYDERMKRHCRHGRAT